MAKRPTTRDDVNHVPTAPPPAPAPLAASARDGAELAREEARRYLPNAVRMLAAIAFSPDADAGLHTRQQCIKQISDIAGVIAPAMPSAPPPLVDERGVNGGDDVHA